MIFFFPFGGGGLGGFFILLFLFFVGARVFAALFRSSQGSSQDAYVPGNREFFDGAFSMLAKLASVDGHVSEGVRRKINNFMVYDLRLDNFSYQYARNVFNAALAGGDSFEKLADRFYAVFRGNPGIFQILMDIFYSIASDDGRISPGEEALLNYAARRFGIPESVISALRRKYGMAASSPSRAYAVLGLDEKATEAEIKKAYRRLILEYHPDTVAQKGGEEFKQYATKKFVEIQQAYEEICKQRGIK